MKNVLICFVLAVILSTLGHFVKKNIISISQVEGPSMEPTLFSGDFVFVQKHVKNIENNDIVILRIPPGFSEGILGSELLIKRVVSGPNSKIYIEDSKLYLNDQLVDESKNFAVRWQSLLYDCRFSDFFTTNADQYFVMGDNRCASYDSRNFYGVPSENIEGKVIYVFTLFRSWKF